MVHKVWSLTYQPRPKDIQDRHQHKDEGRGTIYPLARMCLEAPGVLEYTALVISVVRSIASIIVKHNDY